MRWVIKMEQEAHKQISEPVKAATITSRGSRPTTAACAAPVLSRKTKCGIPCTPYSATSGAHFVFSMFSITKLTLSL